LTPHCPELVPENIENLPPFAVPAIKKVKTKITKEPGWKLKLSPWQLHIV
jgi:hypothetical protein